MHECYGCAKRKVGCRSTCSSWKLHEAMKKLQDVKKRKSIAAYEINERESCNAYQAYIKEQKGKPRSASNYY